MSDEEKKLLEETAENAEECLKILRRMQRVKRFELVFKIAYWAVIIGLAFGAYYLVQPYLDSLMSVYGGLEDNVTELNNLKSSLLDFKPF